MIRVFVLYPEAPDPERYAEHVELSRREAPGATIRHGRILGSPTGKADYAHYFEFEWADMDGFKAAVSSDEFAAAGKDAMEMGIPFTVAFAEIAE